MSPAMGSGDPFGGRICGGFVEEGCSQNDKNWVRLTVYTDCSGVRVEVCSIHSYGSIWDHV